MKLKRNMFGLISKYLVNIIKQRIVAPTQKCHCDNFNTSSRYPQSQPNKK